ncbi:MAG TPA: TIGR03620 family F420-dependent LLM class oxidoreductase, partial [Candidatus Acidoferrum sp.]|nr:TIGR03620 family F420-dependent LLM class oxidoreductase [Candidatus Acidoferrum sp.]
VLVEALSGSSNLTLATGILNIWAWDPAELVKSLADFTSRFNDRFILGLGVSHAPLVAALGRKYDKPLAQMVSFLDELDLAESSAPAKAFRVLAALRPKMLELAATRGGGAHPYFVPAAHSAAAREVLGAEPLLAPEVAVVLEADPAEARRQAREYMALYLGLPNYVGNLRDLGFSVNDVSDGGSDRLVDALIAWGDLETIRGRIKEHLAAGADHVAVQPVGDRDRLETLRELAPALKDL